MKSRFLIIALVALGAITAVDTVRAPAHDHNGDPFAELITDTFELQPATGKFQEFKVLCPTGYSAIVGTLREIPPGVAVGTSIASGPTGRIWTFELENATTAKLNISVQVRCVQDIVFQQKFARVGAEPQSAAEAKAKCGRGFRAIGRGEHVSPPGPPDGDDFEAFFSVYLAVLGIDEVDVGITDVAEALDYYAYVICGKAAPDDDKAAGKKPKLKTKTVTGATDAKAFNFAQIDLKCPRGYSPTTPSWGPLPAKVKGFADIPGTKTTQPVRFLNTSPDEQHLEGSLLCITVR